MMIQFIDILHKCIDDPSFLHDIQKHKDYLADVFGEFEHCECVMMYSYTGENDSDECVCGERIRWGWNYCPHCGEKIQEIISICDQEISKICKEYKIITCRVMPDDEKEKIVGKPVLKVWYNPISKGVKK